MLRALVCHSLALCAAEAFVIDGMDIKLDSKTQTLASLTVSAPDTPSGTFDFLPDANAFHGSHHLGDVTLRVRSQHGDFASLSSARADVEPLTPSQGEIAAGNISISSALPIELVRRYRHAESGGLQVSFDVRNTGEEPLEIGAFGASMIFRVMGVGGKRNLDELAGNCSMVDPSITGEHSWVSVTRMTGTGEVLLIAPEIGTRMEAWRRLKEASGGQFYELTSLSKDYAENEWRNSSTQWVEPTSLTLAAGESTSFAYRIFLAKSLREKDAALASAGFAVLQGVPGYSIASDMASALLHVLPPASQSISSITVSPLDAITIQPHYNQTADGFFAVGVKGEKTGRARVSVTYSDGSTQVANYFVLPPLQRHVAHYGRFQASTAWYANVSDPFGRGNSVFPWNRQLKKHIGVGAWDNGYEDNRIFNNGLSDEAGAGANLGFAAKVGLAPVADEVEKLDLYITTTLHGVKKGLPFGASLQCVEGEEASETPSCGPASVVGPTTDGIMSSMFWVPNSPDEERMPGYDYNPLWFCTHDCPPGWPGWRWDQARGASLGRAYNYAHQSAVYLFMYLAARNYQQLNTVRPATWYLNRAYGTVVGMWNQASWYSHQGLMDGTNFRTVLECLQDEGMTEEAAHVTEIMRNRTLVGVTNKCRYYVIDNVIHDRGVAYPGCHWYLVENVTTPWASQTGLPGAGSEFAWDTTGQEEAYVWGMYFNASHLAESALNQILSYTPLVPNFAWHGSAYGMGDFSNNGYVRFDGGHERVLQHYRSGLNSIPSLEAFMRDPTDLYLLRLAAGSISGVLTNIDEDGAASMGFHADPSNLFFDPASGDHGLAFFGHTHNTGSFIVNDTGKGWLCYFCDLTSRSDDDETTLIITPRDTYHRRVFLAPLGLQLVSDAGTVAQVRATFTSGSLSDLTAIFDPVGEQPLTKFRLRFKGEGSSGFHVKDANFSRGSYEITPGAQGGETAVAIAWDQTASVPAIVV